MKTKGGGLLTATHTVPTCPSKFLSDLANTSLFCPQYPTIPSIYFSHFLLRHIYVASSLKNAETNQ